MGINIRTDTIHIIRMDPAEPLVGLVADFMLFPSEHRFPAGREADPIGSQIPVPQSIVCSAGSEFIPLFAVAQSLLGMYSGQLRLDAREHYRKVQRFGDVIISAGCKGLRSATTV